MAIPLEIRVREAYAAFGRGDVEGFSACTEEFLFNVPGGGALARMYCGKSGIQEVTDDERISINLCPISYLAAMAFSVDFHVPSSAFSRFHASEFIAADIRCGLLLSPFVRHL